MNAIEKWAEAPFEAQAQLFRVLRHPARLAILEALRNGEQCVCHLEAVLGCRQAYISQHLMSLREAGLVQDRREGWNIFYRVTETRIYPLLDAARAITGPEDLPASGAQACACPKCKVETALDGNELLPIGIIGDK